MKIMRKLALWTLAALAALCLPSLSLAQQNFLSQTTITAAIPTSPSTNPFGSSQTFIVLASVPTGVSGILLNQTTTINQQNIWQAYIDRELMTIVAINGLVAQVQRGQGGTVASPHAAGAMVLIGRAFWFYNQDPGANTAYPGGTPANVPCVVAQVLVSPYVNIRTGAQWVCSAASLTWQPGFGSPLLAQSSTMATTASVAGATNIAFPVTTISGTNAITSWTFTGNGAIGVAGNATANSETSSFCVIPSGAFTYTATNNIGSAGTAVVGQVQCWYWGGQAAKWYPAAQ
jgi:hypothetical protein